LSQQPLLHEAFLKGNSSLTPGAAAAWCSGISGNCACPLLLAFSDSRVKSNYADRFDNPPIMTYG
jgi:hypothetical protein